VDGREPAQYAEFAHILRFSRERVHMVNAVVVSVYSFRTPCVCLQRRVLAHSSATTAQWSQDAGTLLGTSGFRKID
jgi:hypothetical protein